MPKGKVEGEFTECNGTAGFSINNKLVQPNELKPGTYTLDFTYDYEDKIIFYMFGKDRDTKLVNGKIIKDKAVIIKRLFMEYLIIEDWQFHSLFFDPYFGVNNEKRIMHVPDKNNFCKWSLKLQVSGGTA